MGSDPTPAVVRVRPDISAVEREFDYLVPELWRASPADHDLRVGGRVRIELHGRRVGGWITELDPDTPEDLELRPLRKWSGLGPSAEVIELCDWSARRWAGAAPKLLRTASPARNVYRLRSPRVERWAGEVDPWAAAAFEDAGSVAVVPPAGDRWPLVLAAATFGNPLILVPAIADAERLARRLRRAGLQVALMPDDWDRAAAGAVVVGTRAAAFAPVHELGAVLMLDEHDEVWREERMPTWHAREVAVERARRAGVPCVLVSPVPTPHAVGALPLHAAIGERAGWPAVELIDRRDEPPGRLGLFSESLGRKLDGPGRVACILNRTGRVRLLACSNCGATAACEHCGGAVRQVDDRDLTCVRCERTRPPACAECGSSRLKNLVLGVGRAREELAALIGEPVGERTASGADLGDARVVIGTEALLRDRPDRASRFERVVFLDFDQHLAAPRQAAEIEAMTLLVLAARQVGARSGPGRILVQTRMPEHRVLQAALRGESGALTRGWVSQADSMGWPPTVAQVEVSGAGAEAFMAGFGRPIDMTVLGPRDGVWQVRAPDGDRLLDELARVERGDERLRLDVD